MSLRKSVVGASVIAAVLAWAGSALAAPKPYELGLQAAASPVMERIEGFHTLLVWIIAAITAFVAALLVIVMVRYNRRVNPVPSKTHHNTLLEVAWTVIPVVILVIIAIPSFKLLYYEAEIPPADVHLKVIGKQWYWTYEYPQSNFGFDSQGLTSVEAAAGEQPDRSAAAGKPRLLGVDNPLYLPVNKVIEVTTVGADVIHSWALPEMGVKMDAVPGRLNHTWFKATRTGVFYGQCSELCGVRHAFMPIEVHIVTDAEYAAWLAAAKKNTKIYQPIADASGARELAAQ
jgi:cytochrome c oxidase subunit 2